MIFRLTFLALLLAGCVTSPEKDASTGVTARAARGDLKALNRLGYIYYYGEGVPRDLNKAVDCFTRAAAGGRIRR